MFSMSECKRDNLCVDCDNNKCCLAGKLLSDCPKYRCDRTKDKFEDCDSCDFIKDFVKEQREYYKRKRRI